MKSIFWQNSQKLLVILLGGIILVVGLVEADDGVLRVLRKNDSPQLRKFIVGMARLAVEGYVRGGKVISLLPNSPTLLRIHQAGVFVTIIRGNKVRGCMGSVYPTQKNIGLEIINSAIKASYADKRFLSIGVKELAKLKYSVAIVGAIESVVDFRAVNPQKYGLWVRLGSRGAVMLPGEGKTADWAFREACRKAKISPNEQVQIFKFEVVKFEAKSCIN